MGPWFGPVPGAESVKKFQFHCCVWPAAIVNPRSIRQCTGIVVSFSLTHRRSLRRFSFTGHLRPPAGKLQNFRLNLTQNLASIGRSHTRIIRNCHANANCRELDAIGHSALRPSPVRSRDYRRRPPASLQAGAQRVASQFKQSSPFVETRTEKWLSPVPFLRGSRTIDPHQTEGLCESRVRSGFRN